MSALVERLKDMFFGDIPLAVARSLRDHPEQWSDDTVQMGKPHRLQHIAGPSLWVANSYYGMSVETPIGFSRRTAFGGVTALSSFGLSPGHHLLRHAANKWLRAHGTERRPEARDVKAALSQAVQS